jgi:hypothetical protein
MISATMRSPRCRPDRIPSQSVRRDSRRKPIPQLILEVDQNATIKISLKVGAISEAVSVTAETAALDTRTATLSTVINQQQINDLPLNGRNVLQLMQLTPGTLVGSGTFNQSATRPEVGSQLISASGGRGNSTTFVLDGGLHEDPYTEVANVTPNPDAIQEFSFQTNNYSAKFGGRGGGVVNMVTKSGSNGFHGSWQCGAACSTESPAQIRSQANCRHRRV